MKPLRLATFAAFVMILGLALILRPSGAERIAAELLNQKLLNRDLDEQIADVLTIVTEGVSFDHKWQVNAPPKIGFLNVYILDSKSERFRNAPLDLSQLFHNGAYIGSPNIIVLDTNSLEETASRFDLYRWVKGMPSAASQEAAIRKSILTWILGHEIGHILSGHKPEHVQNLVENILSG